MSDYLHKDLLFGKLNLEQLIIMHSAATANSLLAKTMVTYLDACLDERLSSMAKIEDLVDLLQKVGKQQAQTVCARIRLVIQADGLVDVRTTKLAKWYHILHSFDEELAQLVLNQMYKNKPPTSVGS